MKHFTSSSSKPNCACGKEELNIFSSETSPVGLSNDLVDLKEGFDPFIVKSFCSCATIHTFKVFEGKENLTPIFVKQP